MSEKPVYQFRCASNCELKSVFIHAGAICRLQGQAQSLQQRWLCDECVNGILAAMVEEDMDVYVFSSYMHHRLQVSIGYKSALSRKEIILTKRKWLMPACILSHWTAAVVDIQSHNITMLDSFHVQQLSFAKRITEFANCFLPHMKNQWSIHYDNENVPLQANTYDCGVLMLKALQPYVTKSRLPIDPMNCAVYRHQFLDVIRAKCIQQSPLQPSNESEYCSPSNYRVRPPLKMRKPNANSNNRTTIPISLAEQKPTINQLSSKSTLSQNIPEAKISNTKPCNDSKVHAGYPLGANVDSKTKGMLQIDNAKHSAINQPHQKHPKGSDITKDVPKIHSDQSSTNENDKHSDTPSKATHSEESISPPCCTAKHKANSSLKWDELHPSLQSVLPPGDDCSYVVDTYQEIDSDVGDSPHFSATIRINLANEDDATKWISKMSNHSSCTYRTTKTVKTCNKRVKCKFVKHCQHFAKKLSQKQKEKSAL